MRCRNFVAAVALAVASIGVNTSLAAEPPVALAIILDCSKSMETPVPMGDGVTPDAGETNEQLTRLDASKQILQMALRDLAHHGNYSVGLWLLGHRVAWEDSELPGLLEQTDYLAQTNGFSVLQNLVPGDDVEMVRHVRPLKPEHLMLVASGLNTIKPWGESPVYLALARAIDEFGMASKQDRRGIILITDGGNEQWKATQTRTLQNILSVHYRRHVPVHIIGIDLNKEDHAQAINDYEELARRTGGSFRQVSTATKLDETFCDVVQKISDPSAQATEEVATGAGNVAVTPVASDRPRAAAKSQIQGVVLFQGRPVPNATVRTTGTISVTVKTDKQGAYTIANVPVGEYELFIEGIAKNKIREATARVMVDAPPTRGPYIETEIE